MSKTLKFFCLGIILTLTLLSHSTGALAAGFTISPVNTYLQVDGGERQSLVYNLKNDTDQDYALTLAAKSFTAGVTGEPQFESSLDFPYFSLAEASKGGTVILAARTNQDFTVIVEPPYGVVEKEYPLTLFFQLTPTVVSEDKSTVVTNLGTNLIVLVGKSNIDHSQLTVKDFKWPIIVDSFFAQPIKMIIENQGDNGTLLYGKVTLQRRGGEIIAEKEFYPDLVLADSVRQARWKLPADAQGSTSLTDQFDLPQFLFGQYQLKIELASVYATTLAQTTLVTANFFAFPYRLLLILLVLGLIVWIWKRRQPRLNRRQADELFSQKMASMREQNDELESKS